MFLLKEERNFEIDGIKVTKEQWKKHIEREFESKCFQNNLKNCRRLYNPNIEDEEFKLVNSYINEYLYFQNQANENFELKF